MEKGKVGITEDVKVLKANIAKIELALELAESIINGVRDPLVVLDGEFKVLIVNKSFYDAFRVKPNETIGRLVYDLGNRQWDIPKLRNLLEDILPHKTSFDNYIIEHDFPEIGKRLMVLNARRIPPPPVKPERILLSIEDVTELERIKLLFEKMLEKGVFSKLLKDRNEVIVCLEEEVNALLVRLSEKIKYKERSK